MAKVVIRDARLSFPDLFEAVQYQGSGPYQFRATFLIDPSNPSKALIDAAIEQVAKEKWPQKWQAILPEIKSDRKACCFIDGNRREYAGYAGNWALGAVRNLDAGRPVVVDRDKSPLSAGDGKLYGGCYVNGTVEIWAQDNNFGKAIRATLVNVQFVKHGESFGGAAPATADALDDLGYDGDDDDLA